MAQAIAAAGGSVAVMGRRKDLLDRLVESLDGDALAFEGDITSVTFVDDAIREIAATWGRIDVLVNAAGISKIAPATEEQLEDFRRIIEVNLVAPFALCQRVAKVMLSDGGGGSIINVASIVGLVGLGRMPQAGYASSKGGLANMTRELAAQWARRGIRVNAIAPAWFETEMTRELFDSAKGVDWVSRLTPMGRPGDLCELDGATIFLASNASSYVTGVVLPVDGGWTAV